MIAELNQIEVLTLFVPDVAAAKLFYLAVFGLPVIYEDDQSAVMQIGAVMINLLQRGQAPELVAPQTIAPAGSGPNALLTIKVADVDRVCAELAGHSVALLNGPINRPWGRRTAAFADPAGYVWEIAQDI